MVLQQKGQLIDALKSLNKTKSAIRGNKRASSVSKCCMCCTQAFECTHVASVKTLQDDITDGTQVTDDNPTKTAQHD